MMVSWVSRWLLPALLCSAPLVAMADHDHHRHKHKGGNYKEEFWDGQCMVERKWKRNGEFKEKRKCDGRHVHAHRPPPQPVVVYPAAPPGAIVISPQVVIRP